MDPVNLLWKWSIYGESDKSSNENNEPPVPNENNKNSLAIPMEKPHFRITVTNESNMPQFHQMSIGGPTNSSYYESSNRYSQMSQSLMESIDTNNCDIIVDIAYNNNKNENENEMIKNPILDEIIINTDLNNISNDNININAEILDEMKERLEYQNINCENDTPLSTNTAVTMVLKDISSQNTNLNEEIDSTKIIGNLNVSNEK